MAAQLYIPPSERPRVPEGGPSRPVAGGQAPRRRARLAELDPHIHCSILGTCLSMGDLRRLMPRYSDFRRDHPSDLELHHAAVQFAVDGGEAAKALHKALDDRHAAAIRRFDKARTTLQVRSLWDASLEEGDVPGAYWAVMTHPDADAALRRDAFGEVHMLSHLMGAANRADIRRLVAMEQEIADLKDKVGRQQQRLQAMSHDHAQALDAMSRRTAETVAAPRAVADEFLSSELAALGQAVAHERLRREQAERISKESGEARILAELQLEKAREDAHALRIELSAMESVLARGALSEAAEPAAPSPWQDKRVVYVGGRPSSLRTIRSLAAGAGVSLAVHDGGIEDRKGLLAATLAGADAVVFPVDCVDHDSMSQVKRVCDRHGVAWHALRSSSVAAFAAWIFPVRSDGAPPVSRFCLRHG
jgi:hypothetical protein